MVFCIFARYPVEIFFEKPNRADNKPYKAGIHVLGVEMEKVKQLINQKEKGYLTYGKIDALFLLNTFFPERSVV